MRITKDTIAEMREWAMECEWVEDADEIAAMNDDVIVRGIARHYDGGVAQFILDEDVE